MRNLGGAVGLAGLTTILNDRTDLHLARLHEAVTWSRAPALEALNNITQRFSSLRQRRAADGVEAAQCKSRIARAW